MAQKRKLCFHCMAALSEISVVIQDYLQNLDLDS